MKTANLVILESNSEFCKELTNYFDGKERFNVCAVTGNGQKGIEYIDHYKPNIVILNLVLSGCDGVSVLDHIKNNCPECKAIVVSNFSDEEVINSAISHGAKYYFVKPVEPHSIADRITDIVDENMAEYRVSDAERTRRRAASLDEKISKIFISVGIPPHIKGYAYLREGVKMMVENNSVINEVTKKLYPSIAEKFNTTASKVERAIRHAIEVAWNKGRVDAINSIFGVKVYFGSERPTNSEFIALIADKLILEELL